MWYFETLQHRDAFIRAWEAFFADTDALVLPAASTAFPHRGNRPTAESATSATLLGYPERERLLGFLNLTGLPGLAVPAGHSEADGLPIGVQIIGPKWSEPRLIEITRQLERAKVLPGLPTPPSGYR
ncbi:amidase family protein [Haloactinospora alba]|uniref:amidase family protein n=1 Tax=Haloactinospora alba TaxID=405555 RepID=UPI00114DA6F7